MTTHELADKQNRYVTAPGQYIAKVKQPGNGWLGTTKTGTDFIRVPLLIEDEGDQHEREIVWQGWLSEKAVKRTVQTLDDAFGKNWTIASLEKGISPFFGKSCRITVEAEEYKGDVRYKIKWLNPLDSAPREYIPLPPERIKTLDDRIINAREDEDEIPF